ncbi:MAG TPA: ComF family protein [Candidatus Dormibacteraeota bacterium]
MLSRVARLLLDAVAPLRCAGCDCVSDTPICPGCVGDMTAMPVPRPRRMRHGIAFAGFEFEGPVRSALHRGKYGGDRGALAALGALTAARLDAARARSRLSMPDAAVGVPLGPRRRRQRGYNQSDLIARVIADARRLPLVGGLQRIRDTAPQSARAEDQRGANVAGAFAWTGMPLARAQLWLVDDVLTTGATAEAAATALQAAGAARIDVVVVAMVP